MIEDSTSQPPPESFTIAITKQESFTDRAFQKTNSNLQNKCLANAAYIEALENLLREHNIPLPQREAFIDHFSKTPINFKTGVPLLKDATPEEISAILNEVKKLMRQFYVTITFKELGVWNMSSPKEIVTVGTTIKSIGAKLFCCPGPKKTRVDILKGLSGCIRPGVLTLLIGPPGCGKSVFLKSLSGRMGNNVHVDGEIFYNEEPIESDKFLIPKISEYIEQGDTHAPTLTVLETIEFAWMSTSGGHHSYGVAADETAAAILNKGDANKARVQNLLKIIGLEGCKNTYVGDGAIRGVSGGQKRRVTSGELSVTPRPVKMMDAISNGLDSATTYDIVNALRLFCHTLGSTMVLSLLQPPPEVFSLFDEIILMSEGEFIYHGPGNEVLHYFDSIGYVCPSNVDLADFLQVIPTPDSYAFMKGAVLTSESILTPKSQLEMSSPLENKSEDLLIAATPRGTKALVAAWKNSPMYLKRLEELNESLPAGTESNGPSVPKDVESGSSEFSNKNKVTEWHPQLREPFAGTWWFHFKLTLHRQAHLITRDVPFIKGRIMQNLLVGAIAGSLFSNIPPKDISTMSGFLFFCIIFPALTGFAMMSSVFGEKAVFYKHSASLFYPTTALTLSQAIVLYPLQLIEILLFSTIVYWSAGLSADKNGGRFFIFLVTGFVFSVTMSQFFRLIAFVNKQLTVASSMAGIFIVLMVLFSGFILPKNQIPDWWIWFYYINPFAYALKAVTINQYLSTTYHNLPACPENPDNCPYANLGIAYLESVGMPTTMDWVGYSIAILLGMYYVLFVLATLALEYFKAQPAPPARAVPGEDVMEEEKKYRELPFESVSFAFKNIQYTVKTKEGDELELLHDVNGFFAAGSVTCLMGSSGAGKTTLLDVLAGRKTTGTITGEMCVNGYPKDEAHFRRIMAYVEQFDTLSTRETARDAIEFSAALRLPIGVSNEDRNAWIEAVVDMMELRPIEDVIVGLPSEGGMSFEQKKRLSIAVELAANPAILFLDEPTTGLDSRAAQIVCRSIRNIAKTGRCVVCTIHQPSFTIFNAFDSLLLLRRGGQTVYFGRLGENCQNLIRFFESAPNVRPIQNQQNPATWMLEAIGAGTTAAKSNTDFHRFYVDSELNESNQLITNQLCTADPEVPRVLFDEVKYRHSFFRQLGWVGWKTVTQYWRTPSYNVARVIICIIVALIFSSAYPQQKYTTDAETIARSAVIYITCLFLGVISLQTVMPVVHNERSAFYREQQSKMYEVWVFTVATFLVEIPYLLVSALCFVIPFFYIVGFDNVGDVTQKFFYYWFIQSLYMAVLVYFGQMYVYLTPTKPTADVAAGITSTMFSLFSGFLIQLQNMPTFWIFMYWLDPLHYALEALISAMFKGDTTLITLTQPPPSGLIPDANGQVTAEQFIRAYYPSWSYDNIGYDILALCLFVLAARVATWYCQAYLRHDIR